MTANRQSPSPPYSGWQRRLVLFLDRQIYKISRHWLALFNFLLGAYTLLPILAPILMANGAPQVGRWIYVLYMPACHQLPQRSFFLFGPQITYTLEELWALGAITDTSILGLQKFLGSPDIGFKIAICQRDVALYGSLFLGGLLFSFVRRRLKPLSFLGYGLFLLPMAIDGGTQLFGLRESNALWRTITGVFAGIGSIWLLYPHVESAFSEIGYQANRRVEPEIEFDSPEEVRQEPHANVPGER